MRDGAHTHPTRPAARVERSVSSASGSNVSVSRAYAEAAGVSFSRHHKSPADLEISINREASLRQVSWDDPTSRARQAWNNADDATRDGAYAVSLAVIEAELGLVAIARAETKTGADFYLGTLGPDPDDTEGVWRLEVSGTQTPGGSALG